MAHHRGNASKNEGKFPELQGDHTYASWENDKRQITMMTWWDRKTGAMSRAVYSFYLRQFTCSQILPLALLFALAQLCRFAMDAFLSRWAVGDPALVPEGLDPTIAYCIGYAILGVSTFVFSGLRYVWAQLIGLSASWKMHNLMLSNLLHAPVSFFDVTPIGRIGELPTFSSVCVV